MQTKQRALGRTYRADFDVARFHARVLASSVVLLAVLAMVSSRVQAGEPASVSTPETDPISWAYDPSDEDLFGAKPSTQSGFDSVSADRFGAVGDDRVGQAAPARQIASDTRFGSGQLDDILGKQPRDENLAATAPMFDGDATVAQDDAASHTDSQGKAGASRYSGQARLTSRVSEFDGDPGELFKQYIQRETAVNAKQPIAPKKAVLAHPESVTKAGGEKSMPRQPAVMTSKVTHVERLEISPTMLRNVH